MTRPTVQLDSRSDAPALRRHLQATLPRFTAPDGVLGVTLNGGLSRGYADHLSEIDVTVYLTLQALERWQQTRAPFAAGITVLDGQLYDIKIVDYDTERERPWEAVALWDASYAEILYDPLGLLAALFAVKLGARPEPLTAEGPLFRCWWYYRLAGDIWIYRGDVLQGHQMLNQAITPLLEALFLANAEYVPHEKWLVHLSRSLAWRPDGWVTRLQAAMSTGEMDGPSLRARQAAIDGLWAEVDTHIRAACCPDLPVYLMQKTVYERLLLLAQRGSMPVAEWRALTGGGVPNADPFHPVIRVHDGRITLDRAALLATGPEQMYAWHHAVLRAVAEAIAPAG